MDGADVLVSNIRRTAVDGRTGVELRFVAMSDDGAAPTVTGEFTEVVQMDLLGRTLATTEAAGSLEIEFGPCERRTLVLL